MGLCMRLHILAVQAQIELLLLPRVCLEHEGLRRKKTKKNIWNVWNFYAKVHSEKVVFLWTARKMSKNIVNATFFFLTSVSNVFFLANHKWILLLMSEQMKHMEICRNGKSWQVSTVFKEWFRRHPGDTVYSIRAVCVRTQTHLSTQAHFPPKYWGISRDLMWHLRSAFPLVHLATCTHFTEQKVIHAVSNQGE